MGIPFTMSMGFLLTATMGNLFTMTLGIQLTISRKPLGWVRKVAAPLPFGRETPSWRPLSARNGLFCERVSLISILAILFTTVPAEKNLIVAALWGY